MKQIDYYEILGVPQDADAKKIKEAYREMAFRYHPDRNKDDATAVEKMKQVNEAYAVLSNAEKRSEYDLLRSRFGSDGAYGRFRRQYTDQDIFTGTDINRVFDELARSFGFRGFEEIFREFYGPNTRKFHFTGPGGSLRGFFFFGAFGPGNLPLPKLFQSGKLGRILRPLLGKAGESLFRQSGGDLQDTIRIGPDLARQGGPYAYFHHRLNKKLVVKIPPGVQHGQRIRLAGMGLTEGADGRPGDLYLRVELPRTLLEKIRDLLPGAK
ncbi:MAG: DnaJ domain-containing protein [Thermodesulfobacteriota bacterium]